MPCSRNQFKVMAVIFMIIDHIGAFLLNDNILFRFVGRFAFPMFVYLLADGFWRAKNLKSYFLRLVSLYVISIIPYSLAISGRLFCPAQNIYASLFLYLLLFCVLGRDSVRAEKKFLKGVKILAVVVSCAFAAALHLEYSWYGVLTAVLLFYMNDLGIQLTAWFLAFVSLIYGRLTGLPIQVAASLPVFIVPYQGKFIESPKPDKRLQWMFYLFYPVHLLFFAALRM